MTSEGLQNVKIKCRIAKAQRMSSAGLGKYVELREKLGFPKRKSLTTKTTLANTTCIRWLLVSLNFCPMLQNLKGLRC